MPCVPATAIDDLRPRLARTVDARSASPRDRHAVDADRVADADEQRGPPGSGWIPRSDGARATRTVRRADRHRTTFVVLPYMPSREQRDARVYARSSSSSDLIEGGNASQRRTDSAKNADAADRRNDVSVEHGRGRGLGRQLSRSARSGEDRRVSSASCAPARRADDQAPSRSTIDANGPIDRRSARGRRAEALIGERVTWCCSDSARIAVTCSAASGSRRSTPSSTHASAACAVAVRHPLPFPGPAPPGIEPFAAVASLSCKAVAGSGHAGLRKTRRFLSRPRIRRGDARAVRGDLLLYDSQDLDDARRLRRHDRQRQDRPVPRAARRGRHRRHSGDLHRSQGRPRQPAADVSGPGPADFEPWIDPAEAQRKGRASTQYAAQDSRAWKKGWPSGGRRPSASASFATPSISRSTRPAATRAAAVRCCGRSPRRRRRCSTNSDALRERIAAAASGLLALLASTPIRSTAASTSCCRTSSTDAWRNGQDLDMAGLIRAIQKPPFDKVGVIDLETLLSRQGTACSWRWRSTTCSPRPASRPGWKASRSTSSGCCTRAEGKPRIAIISIAHLSRRRADVLRDDRCSTR